MQQEATKTGQKKQTTPQNLPAEKKVNQVAISQDFADGGWDTEVVDTKDILIPKILLMHPTSDLVKKGQRNIGEVIKSTDEAVVAKRGETFDVIVFEKWKDWRIMKKNPQSGRFEYVRTEAWTPDNDNSEWDFTEGNDTYRRDKTMNFYGLLTSDIAKGSAFPVRLAFVRTGFKTGLKIADAYARALMDKQPPTRQSFKIGAELKEGKEESYFAFTAAPGEATTEEQKKVALQWRQIVTKARQSNTIVDDEVDETPVTSNAGNSTEF